MIASLRTRSAPRAVLDWWVLFICIFLQAWSAGAAAQGADTTPPTAPHTLTAGVTGNTQIEVTWRRAQDNVAVTGYRIYRNGSSTPHVSLAVTHYTDTGLTPGTTYTYTVRAVDAAGNESAPSGAASARTPGTAPVPDTTPPSTPGTPAATAVSSSRIDLSWSASTDAVGVSGYRIFRNGSTTPRTTVTTTT